MLTPEQKAAMKAAVAAYWEPIEFGRSMSEFVFAAGIAYERARADKLQAAIDAYVKVEGLHYGDDPAAYDEWARQAPIAWATLEALATKEPQS